MNRFPYFAVPDGVQFDKRRFLGLFWIVGLFTGGGCFLFGADRLMPLMRVSLNGNVSIVCFLCLIFLPPFLSILAASTGMHSLLYVIAFGKAFLYAFASMALRAGWFACFWASAEFFLHRSFTGSGSAVYVPEAVFPLWRFFSSFPYFF